MGSGRDALGLSHLTYDTSGTINTHQLDQPPFPCKPKIPPNRPPRQVRDARRRAKKNSRSNLQFISPLGSTINEDQARKGPQKSSSRLPKKHAIFRNSFQSTDNKHVTYEMARFDPLKQRSYLKSAFAPITKQRTYIRPKRNQSGSHHSGFALTPT